MLGLFRLVYDKVAYVVGGLLRLVGVVMLPLP
jgi:hypothetical protein